MRKIEKGEMSMLNEEICKLRDKLNKSIEKHIIIEKELQFGLK